MSRDDDTSAAPTRPLDDRFRALMADAPVGICELTAAGELVFANERCRAIAGIGLEQARGLGWMNAIHPDDRERVIAEWAEALARDREFEIEYRFLHPDGRVVWIASRATKLTDERGRLTGVLGTMTDITAVKRAEERLELRGEVIRNMAEGVCVVRVSDELVVYANPAFERMLGYGPGELAGVEAKALCEPAGEGESSRAELLARLGSGDPVSREARKRRKDGGLIWCRGTISTFEHPEYGAVWIVVEADITEERRSRAALREAEQRFRRAFEDSASGMALIEARRPDAGRFLEVNPALIRISGYSAAELLEMSYQDLVHPDEVVQMRAEVGALVAGRLNSIQCEWRMIGAGGRTRWIAFSASLIRDENDNPVSAVAQAQDVTDRKLAEEELRFMADHDPLTGLFNRRRFERELERELSAAARRGQGGAMLVLDLDQFKLVNDSCGHAAGDDLLKQVAAALVSRLGDEDVIARLGGDEFGILLPGADEGHAVRAAEELRAAVRELVVGEGLRVTASVGVCGFRGPDDAAGDRVVADADAAMYAAKERGRDRVGVRGDRSSPLRAA